MYLSYPILSYPILSYPILSYLSIYVSIYISGSEDARGRTSDCRGSQILPSFCPNGGRDLA